MVAERCVSKSGAVSADPHHTCRYGSSPAAHRLVVPALSFHQIGNLRCRIAAGLRASIRGRISRNPSMQSVPTSGPSMGPRPAPRSQAARGAARSPYPGRPRLPKIVLDRAARHPRRTPDLPRAYAVVAQSQHLPQSPHGQLSSGRHEALVDDRGGLMSGR